MEFSVFFTTVKVFLVLLALSSPFKFIQSPSDFGPLNFLETTTEASEDFGRIVFNPPSAVLRPRSPKEISQLLKFLSASSFSKVTVAARGVGHSIHGQAQALKGIVIEMDSLPSTIKIHKKREGDSGFSFADVSGGTLWVELLEESLKHGLAPRTWTDYLYLTIGGTLSNAGISGQTFKHGPQISNVLRLDVVTGKGDLVTCSPTQSSELFNAVLGGLGQFGIITSARILLQDAPEKVKWVRAFYNDFDTFTKDQELLVSMADKIDYVEGFMVLSEQSLHSSFVAFPSHLDFTPDFHAGGRPAVYYCIEFVVHNQPAEESDADQVVEAIAKHLNFMPARIYKVEVSYFDFLNRVRMEELSLKRRGLWDVSHPWLNMFVPRSGIKKFTELLLDTISPDTFEGPILIYPILRDKWNSNTSAVLPTRGYGEKKKDEEDAEGEKVVYVVGMLRSSNPSDCSRECLEEMLQQNRYIAETAGGPAMGAKQYLPYYTQGQQWREHFGGKWDRFLVRKLEFDPLGILAPGQGIFRRKYSISGPTFE
ncbi:cytokinin dehydrogenase 3-like [Aristolochia californica]|uniref:cytokinin dehydrogenase 3-like n=1 Tax=Aristolochia californica TaxID=171875 RepID=UPI0035E22D65